MALNQDTEKKEIGKQVYFVSIAIALLGAIAFYQYREGVNFAIENRIDREGVCDFHRLKEGWTLPYFKLMGCKSKALEYELELGAHQLDEFQKRFAQEMQKEITRKQAQNALEAYIEQCQEEGTCAEGGQQGAAPSATDDTPPPADCEDLDSAGFLPEC